MSGNLVALVKQNTVCIANHFNVIVHLSAFAISDERYLAERLRGAGRRAGSMQRAIPYMVTKTHVLCDWSSRQQSRVGTAR